MTGHTRTDCDIKRRISFKDDKEDHRFKVEGITEKNQSIKKERKIKKCYSRPTEPKEEGNQINHSVITTFYNCDSEEKPRCFAA